MSEAGFLQKTLALVHKDLRVEARGRDTLPPMLAFALAVSLVLAFTLPETPGAGTSETSALLASVHAGFFWVTVLFAGLVGFARTFEIERVEGAIDSLLLAPLDRSGLFLAKAAANLVFILVVETALLPVFALFFALDLEAYWALLLLIVLVDIGFVAVGTLFASLAAQTRSRELLLPLLALPALTPVFIAAVELTADLFQGSALDQVAARGWFGILIAFDIVFTVVGALAFELVLD